MVRKKFSKKEMLAIVSATLFIVLILTFYIWHQMESVRIGYERGRVEEEVTMLRKDVEKLETKKSHLLSLDRVEKIAKEELNLSEPKEGQIIHEELNP